MPSLRSGLGLLLTIAAFTLLPLTATQLAAGRGGHGGHDSHGGRGGHVYHHRHGGGDVNRDRVYRNYHQYRHGPGWNYYNDDAVYPYYYYDPYYDNNSGFIIRFGS